MRRSLRRLCERKVELLPREAHEVLFGQAREGAGCEFAASTSLALPRLVAGGREEGSKDALAQLTHLAREASQGYAKLLSRVAAVAVPPRPAQWSTRPGWTAYGAGGRAEAVAFPADRALVFDVEVAMAESSAPVLAVALGPSGWYSWCCPALREPCPMSGPQTPPQLSELIPLGPGGRAGEEPSVVIGHNVAFDRSFVREAYDVEQGGRRWWDTMSAHIALDGLTVDQQTFRNSLATRDSRSLAPEDRFLLSRSMNNLLDAHAFQCPGSRLKLSKELRGIFQRGSLEEVRAETASLFGYCADDVEATLELHGATWARLPDRLPHPATLAGMLAMSDTLLPVSRRWDDYVAASDAAFDRLHSNGLLLFQRLADETRRLLGPDQAFRHDPWMWDEDWTMRPPKRKRLPAGTKPSPAKEDKLKGPLVPEWFRKLCPTLSLDDPAEIPSPTELTSRKYVTPKLLKLTWNGYPLHHSKAHGWGYLNPSAEDFEEQMRKGEWEVDPDTGYPLLPSQLKNAEPKPFPFAAVLELVRENRRDLPGTGHLDRLAVKDYRVPGCRFYRLPHETREGQNVGNPLSAGMMVHLDSETLRTNGRTREAAEVGRWARGIAYWTANRRRVKEQMVVRHPDGQGIILPRVIVSGTVTRRSVERTWMTASNPSAERVGSELKSMVTAPDGYAFVGADVDSEEQWIAAMLGDEWLVRRGGRAPGVGLSQFSRASLDGTKAEGTDQHSLVARSVGISRSQAKVLNYARLYGAGLGLAAASLRRWNPLMSKAEASDLAKRLFALTKGTKDPQTHVWSGGSESSVFSALEERASAAELRTPVLGAAISRSLGPEAGGRYTVAKTRANWVVQSSGVDFLHLLLVGMEGVCRAHSIRSRFLVSIHDEVRFLVGWEDRYRAALALQLVHVYVRAAFVGALGLPFLPASVAFFSQVDVDTVLRKEPHDPSTTPSNPHGLHQGYGVPPGEALTMPQLLALTNGCLDPQS